MDFRLLGPIEVVDGDLVLPLGGPKPRTLLAHLVLKLDQRVPTGRLIDAVWGDHPPAAVRNSLQTYVSHLRKVLGPDRLEGRSAGYVLHGVPEEVDVVRFERLLAEARQAAIPDPATAVRIYRDALALWRGPALDDLAEQPSLRAEIARLEELRLAAIEERVEAELALGRHAEVVPELERLTLRHPLRERLWAQLMVALYRSGRQADALAAFQQARLLLAEELGIDPSPELRRVHEQVLQQDLALDVVGIPLRSYRLLEPVGEGRLGTVHRAYQPQMGREVAIKTFRPQLVNDAAFIRRFEADAQRVARLEHPHVVPLHDYWREPDGAYLVMRYLRGGNLRDRLADGRLDPATVVRVVAEVASALAAAHDLGVVHGDVKPDNILFDEHGTAYLSDFGIATQDTAQREPVTARTDVYGLGLVVCDMLAGNDKGAARFADVLARATATDPGDRFLDAPAFAEALRQALETVPATAAVALRPRHNPYKGLRPFAEADARDFFGRDELIARLLGRLAGDGEAARFLAVVGPSGSGKSSLVRAGLVPAVRSGTIPGSQDWFVLDMVPGSDPFAEFRTALRRVAARPLPAKLADQLPDDPSALGRAAAWTLADAQADLLLIVDQFEEVFTLVHDTARRQAFLDSLAVVATAKDSRLHVVVTLRADFYDHALRHERLAELMQQATEVVVPLTAAQLERAIVGPASRVGVAVEPAVVAQVVTDVVAQPGSLPLLQYALTELFDRCQGATLTADAYRQLGGVSGALARRAEQELGSLDAEGREAARQLLLRLVTLGEGVGDTRRRIARSELLSLPPGHDRMAEVIDRFGRARLLSFDRDPRTREATVEVAHEALLDEWELLRAWIDAAREDLRVERQLAVSAHDWAHTGRDPSFLASGSRLERFEALLASDAIALTPREDEFVAASLAERNRLAAEEASRLQHEQELERRSWRRLRALVAVLTVAALVAATLSAVAVRQSGRLAAQARISTARELAAGALANLEVDPELSILLALQAVEATRATDGTVLPDAEEALHRAVKASRLVRTFPQGGYGLAVSSDGTRLVTTGAATTDNTATVWDLETGEMERVLVGPEVGRVLALFSPDDGLIATTHNDGSVRLWDAATDSDPVVLEGHQGWVNLSAFSPDGRWLATTGDDSTVRIWDVATASEERVLTGHEGPVFAATFSPDSRRLASISDDGTVAVWEPETGSRLATFTDWVPGGPGYFQFIAFSPDGTRLAVTSWDHTVKVWDTETDDVHTLFADADLNGVVFSPDGTRIATGAANATLWDAETGRRLLTLSGHAGEVTQLAFTPDGEGLLTASLDDTTRLWDITAEGSRDWLTVPGPTSPWASVAFHPDGTRFAVPGASSGVTIRDTRTGAVLADLGDDDEIRSNLAFSPDGSRLAATGSETAVPTVPIWDVETRQLATELIGHVEAPLDVAYSPDGRRVATAGGWDGSMRVWDAVSGDLLWMEDGWQFVERVAFSPDGRFLVSATMDRPADASFEFALRVFDARRGEVVDSLMGHESWIVGLAFTPDGRLVSADQDGTARIWDLVAGEAQWTFHHGVNVSRVAVSPDGTRIATAAADGTTRLWDLATRQQVLTLYGHDAPASASGVAFSPDGRFLATAADDGTVALYLLPIDEFVDLARTRVTRSLTDDECRQYLHPEACPAVSP